MACPRSSLWRPALADLLLLAGLVICGSLCWSLRAEAQVRITPDPLQITQPNGLTNTYVLTLSNEGVTPVSFAVLGTAIRPDFLARPRADAFGYVWLDSNDPGGPPFEWIEISDRGTALDLNPNAATTLPLPFPFLFYGNLRTAITITAEGYLTFGVAPVESTNQELPQVSAPNDLISPYWDDLNPARGGPIYWYHDAEEQRFIVQYTNVPLQADLQQRSTFQVILYENGRILFQYLDVASSGGATIGIENELGTDGLSVAYNSPHAADSLAIFFEAVPEYARFLPASGTINPNSSTQIRLSLDTFGLPSGSYPSRFVLATDAPSHPFLPLDVSLEVTPPSFPFLILPEAVETTLNQGQQNQQTITIQNTDPSRSHTFFLSVRGAPSASALSKTAQFEHTAPSDLLFEPDALPGGGAYSVNILPRLPFLEQGELLHFDLNQPTFPDVLAEVPLSFAGDYPYGDSARVLLITNEHSFQSIDLISGRRTYVGRSEPRVTPREVWTELAIDPTDGTLYGSTADDLIRRSYLYRIDPTTGTTTLVAQIQGAPLVAAIAVDDTGQLFGLEIDSDQLVSIDKSTGVAQPIGLLGYNANGAQGMDFDTATRTLYVAAFSAEGDADLRRADRATGQTTRLGGFPGNVHLGFLALPNDSFVEPTTRSRSVPPGGQQTVALTFDAQNLLAGRYEAALAVATSPELGAPEALVPARLTVRGTPSIDLASNTLVFDPILLNDTDTRPLVIFSIGSDTLTISRVTFDNPTYTLTENAARLLPLVLPPNAVPVRLDVRFQPTVAGPSNGTLTIESNDPSTPLLPVALSGVGLLAPAIDVDEDQLTLQTTVGRTTTRTLTILNLGEGILDYEIAPDLDALDGALEPPLFEESFEAGIPASWSVLDRAGAGIIWQPHTDFGGDLGVSNWTGGTGLAAMVSSNISPRLPYDTELRTPFLTATSANHVLTFRANYADRGNGANDFLAVDISIDGGLRWTTVRQWDENLGSIFAGPGVFVALELASYVQPGDAFQLRWRYYSPDPAPDDWYAQIDEVRVGIATDVLNVVPESGTVPPKASGNVAITLDADGLLPGSYESRLLFTSNDPFTPELVLPLTLEVEEATVVATGLFEATPGQTLAVPLRLTGIKDVGIETFAFTLSFDPTLLEPLAVLTDGTLSAGTPLDVDMTSPGRVRIQSSAASIGPNTPDGVLLTLQFRVRPAFGSTPLTLSAFQANDAQLPVNVERGRLDVIPLYGDASLDAALTLADARLIEQHVLGLADLSEAAHLVADVSGNGETTLLDAALIKQAVAGLLDCFPADVRCPKPLGDFASEAPLSWGAPLIDARTLLTQVPLTLGEGEAPVVGLHLTLETAPGGPTFEGLLAPGLPDDWTLGSSSEGQTLTLVLTGPTPLTPGTLALVQLRLPQSTLSPSFMGGVRVNEGPSTPLPYVEDDALPKRFSLNQNYPNPFSTSTTISYDLPQASTVRLIVYNMLGKPVRTLFDQRQRAGHHTLVWDGRSATGAPLASGAYFYRIEAGTSAQTKQMVLIR